MYLKSSTSRPKQPRARLAINRTAITVIKYKTILHQTHRYKRVCGELVVEHSQVDPIAHGAYDTRSLIVEREHIHYHQSQASGEHIHWFCLLKDFVKGLLKTVG